MHIGVPWELALLLLLLLLFNITCCFGAKIAEPPVRVTETSSPGFVHKPENRPLTLSCQFRGTPTPAVTWRKLGATGFEELKPCRHRTCEIRFQTTSDMSTIMFARFTNAHSGVYKCIGANMVNSDSWQIIVVADDSVVMVRAPPTTPVVVTEGDDVAVTCQAEGYPKPINYRWEKAGQSLAEPRYQVSQNGGMKALAISGVRREDAGMYTCTAYNVAAATEPQPVVLDVYFAPDIDQLNSTITLPRGSLGRVRCDAPANPAISGYSWSRNDGAPIPGDGSEVSSRFTFLPANNEMLINPVESNDEGWYLCKIQHFVRSVEYKFRIVVKEAPRFTERPAMTYHGLIGGNVAMPCVADKGSRVYWQKEGKKIEELDRRRYFEKDGTLTISDMREEDGGSFSCRARNDVVEIVSPVQLNIIANDRRPPMALRLVKATSMSLHVMWEPAYVGSESSVTLIMFQKATGTEWKHLEVPAGQSNFVVLDLKPRQPYNVFIQCRVSGELLNSSIARMQTTDRELVTTSRSATLSTTPGGMSTKQFPGITNLVPAETAEGIRIQWNNNFDVGRAKELKSSRIIVEVGIKPAVYTKEKRANQEKQFRQVADLPINTTQYLFKEAKINQQYEFRVYLIDNKNRRSEMERVVIIARGVESTFSVSGPVVWGLVGSLMLSFACILLCVTIVKFARRKKVKDERHNPYANSQYFDSNENGTATLPPQMRLCAVAAHASPHGPPRRRERSGSLNSHTINWLQSIGDGTESNCSLASRPRTKTEDSGQGGSTLLESSGQTSQATPSPRHLKDGTATPAWLTAPPRRVDLSPRRGPGNSSPSFLFYPASSPLPGFKHAYADPFGGETSEDPYSEPTLPIVLPRDDSFPSPDEGSPIRASSAAQLRLLLSQTATVRRAESTKTGGAMSPRTLRGSPRVKRTCSGEDLTSSGLVSLAKSETQV